MNLSRLFCVANMTSAKYRYHCFKTVFFLRDVGPGNLTNHRALYSLILFAGTSTEAERHRHSTQDRPPRIRRYRESVSVIGGRIEVETGFHGINSQLFNNWRYKADE